MRAEVQAVQYWFLWYGDKAVARGGCQMHRRGHKGVQINGDITALIFGKGGSAFVDGRS